MACVAKYRIGTYESSRIPICDILTDIHDRVDDDSLVCSEVTDDTLGYFVDSQSTARALIEPLMQAYFFDAVESDAAIHYIPRNPAVPKTVTTVDDDDLAAHEGGTEGQAQLSVVKGLESEYPREVNVQHINPAKKYERGSQRDNRRTTTSQLVETYNYGGLVLTAAEAKQKAVITLAMRWLERTRYELTLPRKYWHLNPCDPISVTLRGIEHTIRPVRCEYGSPGLLKISGVSEDYARYDSDADGDGGDGGDDDVIDIPSITIIRYLDIPILRDIDDDPGFYVAACGLSSSWPGCVVYKSDDGGVSYTPAASLVNPASIGAARTVLPDGVTHTWDTTSTVDVRMVYGTLASVTEAAALNGANAFLVGDEVLIASTATLIAAKTYRLSNMLRGIRGTDWATSTHVTGERVVKLDATTLRRVKLDTDDIGAERYYKAPTLGQSLPSVTSTAFTNTAVGLHPFSPVHIAGTVDGSNTLTITWYRRTRIGGDWRDYIDVQLGETTEEYEVDILLGGTVVRTIDATSETCDYTEAQRLADGFTADEAVPVNIYQLSSVVGRGYAGSATLEIV